ncbi:Calcineurin-like phosphoesterase superfamily domain containing protein [Desulfovibrio sp. X2]|uniref:metallophosphoesterase family protein n=1 Tax=Desulfovibrio sp. X2 TaxID=941449 RepID=UPI000358A96E|nr:metallophosphoesterase family protein [Desulfovibrio sp. X2]EPR39986.1 Calcineurin-like phosphoesterase superfamily domain containing protein [Desulfovibrio sp. X2]
MRRAVLSDIHGNLHALTAVLDDVEFVRADEILTLGDNIGYGGDPEPVVELLHERGVSSCLGNHELALADPLEAEALNPHAAQALARTRDLMSEDAQALAAGYPRVIIRGGARFVHGAPPDRVDEYLFRYSREGRMEELFEEFSERLCFCGHTHELRLFLSDGVDVTRIKPGPGIQPLDPDTRYVVNAGAVGQPRDGDPRAKYVLWDDERDTLDIRYVDYDVDAAARRILRQGLPRLYADRLYG